MNPQKTQFENLTWEQRKLKNLASFKSGKGLSLKDISDNGKFECISYGSLYTEYGMIIETINKFTNNVPKNAVFSKKDDVLIPASDTTPTGLARASCIEKEGVLLGSDINVITPKENVKGSFLSLSLNHNKSQLIRLIKGTTVKHIHNSDLSEVIVNFPLEIKEQKNIINIFKFLQKIITLHQR